MNGKPKVFRNEIKELRDAYCVFYFPANDATPIAALTLQYVGTPPDHSVVREQMEKELTLWLQRYPVPTMASAIDAKEDKIYVTDKFETSTLMGYSDAESKRTVSRWGLFNDTELPKDQRADEYLDRVYHDVPFRTQEQIQRDKRKHARIVGACKIIVILIVGFPLVIELISLGVTWLGHTLSAISISAGFYKLANAMGWLKESAAAQKKQEIETQNRHFIYHCERNPAGFERLRNENYERDAIERTAKEHADLLERERQKKI